MRMRVRREFRKMEIDMVDNRRCNNETLSYFPKFLQVLFQLFKFLLMNMHEAPIGCRTQISQLFQENNVLQRDIVNLE